MTDPLSSLPATHINLIPEYQLLESLPFIWQQRFAKALELIQQDLSVTREWQDIAEQYEVSPSHFHHKFTSVFDQTPGRYLQRLRLQLAIYYLYTEPNMSVTSIALEVGLGSSQALAKVLRRVLNTSAREIRSRACSFDESFIAHLARLTGHPAQKEVQVSLENLMADSIPFILRQHPSRYYHLRSVTSDSWAELQKSWKKTAPSGQSLMSIVGRWQDISRPSAGHTYQTGSPSPASQSNATLPAGYYLECDILVRQFVWLLCRMGCPVSSGHQTPTDC